MKLIARQKIWLAVVILGNLLVWIIPSDVVENIARDRHTLLGRYSREHLYINLGVLVISLVSFYIDWSTGMTYKRRWFQVIATLMFLMPTLFAVDFILRRPDAQHYVRDSLAYHRPPEFEASVSFADQPQAARSFPNAPPGYPPVACELHADARGFRNQTALDSYDVVVLGDSFAEGSSVSDEHTWAARLAATSGLTVYNLGMSGYSPLHYLESLKEYGLPLKPRYVVCCLYEGNDFRSAKSDSKGKKPSFSARMKKYFKQSPLLGMMDEALIDLFGPMGSDWQVDGAEVLDWLPIAIPDGADAKHYAFAPKQLRDMMASRDEFAVHRYWLNTRRNLEHLHTACREAGAEFILVYAPVTAHVVMPMVADSLPAEKVRAFLALQYKKQLPPAAEFLATLIEHAGARESVVADWCNREGIPFVSLTEPLRRAAAEGRQVYYTYDQHWTPPGHEVVAGAVREFLDEPIAAEAPPATVEAETAD